jgi:hypothetical protein
MRTLETDQFVVERLEDQIALTALTCFQEQHCLFLLVCSSLNIKRMLLHLYGVFFFPVNHPVSLFPEKL